MVFADPVPQRKRIYPGCQFSQCKGLRQIIVGARSKAGELVDQRVTGGEHQHWDVALAALSQILTQREPVDPRDAHIEDDQVEWLVQRQLEPGAAIECEVQAMAQGL